jgi:site-specific DNA recombinase
MTRIAVYARVSTSRQEEEETISSQLGAIVDQQQKDGHLPDTAQIFKDEGFSGSIIERPGLDLLRQAAKAGEIDILYVFDYGRFARDLSSLMLIKDEIESSGVQIISLYERITGEPAVDRLLLQMMGAFFEYEKKKIAQRFHNGKIQKAKRGELVGYNAKYGYIYDKELGTIEPYEPEAIVVRRIFKWVGVDGHSAYTVIRLLDEAGIRPRKNKSSVWSKGVIDRMLRDETYIGKHYYNKTESILPRYKLSTTKYRRQAKTGRRIRDKSEWILHEVPSLIDINLFSKVQEQLKRNVKFKPTNIKHEYLLTSLIKCTCGSARNGDGPAGKKYYRCISRHQYADRLNRCEVGGVNVTVLDGLVWSKIESLLTQPELIKSSIQNWLERQKAVKTNTNVSSIKKKLSGLENERKRYVEAYGKGLIPEELFGEQVQIVNRQVEELQSQLSNNSTNRGITGKIDIDSLVVKATQKLSEVTFQQKKHIVERVINKVIASPQEVTIWGQIPLTALAGTGKVKYEPINRNSRIT